MKYLIAFAASLICLSPVPQQKETGKKIFLLMGQSNMAGRGNITAAFENLTDSRVLMLNANNEFITAKHPIHFDKPKAVGVGPGLTFGMNMAKAYPKDSIYLIPCAVGGTSINKWEPEAFDKSTNTHPYDDAVLRIKEAMKKGKIDGVIWLQGESDSNPKAAATYLSKLTALIARIRYETNNPELPFVVGELGTFRKEFQLINNELYKLPALVSFTKVVTSENLSHKGDTTHFDAPSAAIYGDRFAKAMLELMKK